MKENRKFLLPFMIGVLVAGISVFLCMDNWYRNQADSQKMVITQLAEQLDSIRNRGQADLISNVLNKIDDEFRSNPRRTLSDETIARIVALSFSFKPYKTLKGDSLPDKKLSPERGQLLLLLSSVKMDSGSLQKILFQADFSAADLRGADFRKADLSGVNLKEADLQDANLQGANLNGADLSYANLWGANLGQSSLEGTNLKRADLEWADINGANLKKAILSGANLKSAQLRKAGMFGASMIWADASGAMLNETNLDSASLIGTIFTRAILDGSTLRHATLTRAILAEASLHKTDLTGTELNLVVVAEENWPDLLPGWHVTGATEIQNKYKISSDRTGDPFPYHLEKKEEPDSKATK